jgi:fructose-1-phosphate kinase PfkB-like protein
MVAASAIEGGGGVGVAVLAVDADGEVAQAGHVGERDRFQSADLVAVGVPAAFVVVQADMRQRRRWTFSCSRGWFLFATAR